MSVSDDSESVFSFENQHINQRDGIMDDDSSYYTDPKVALNKPTTILRFDEEKGKRIKVSFFDTALSPDRYIRNAVTGAIQSPYRVGTYDEYLFYSVLLSTGECGQTPPCLFYDNPEQYERHFHTTVSDQAKEAWKLRYHMEMDRRSRKRNKAAAGEATVVK